MGQIKQTQLRYEPKRTDQKLGKVWIGPVQTRYGPNGAVRPKNCPDYALGHIRPPVRDPGPSGPYLSLFEVDAKSSTKVICAKLLEA